MSNAEYLILLAARVIGLIAGTQVPLQKTIPWFVRFSFIVVVLLFSLGSVGGSHDGLDILSEVFVYAKASDGDSLLLNLVHPEKLFSELGIGLLVGLVASAVGFSVLVFSSWLASLSFGCFFSPSERQPRQNDCSISLMVWFLASYLIVQLGALSAFVKESGALMTFVPVGSISVLNIAQTKLILEQVVTLGSQAVKMGLFFIGPYLLVSLLLDLSLAIVNRYAKEFATSSFQGTLRITVFVLVFAASLSYFVIAFSNRLAFSPAEFEKLLSLLR